MNKWLALGAGLLLVLYLAHSVLSPLIIAAALAYAFGPLVDQATRRTRLPRAAIIGLAYVVLLGALSLIIWSAGTAVVREVRAFAVAGPTITEAAFFSLLGTDRVEILGQELDGRIVAAWVGAQASQALQTPNDALHAAERVVDAVLKTLLMLVALFYLLLDGRRFVAYFMRFLPPGSAVHVNQVLGRMHAVLGQYLRGQLFLIALMAGVTYPVLAFGFRLPFALAIALATGILEVIPFFGPVTAGGIAAVVALAHGGPAMMVAIIVVYVLLRQIEDQLVMPIVVGRSVELHPLVAMFAVLTGGAAAGALGAVLAIPLAAAGRVTLDYAFQDLESGDLLIADASEEA